MPTDRAASDVTAGSGDGNRDENHFDLDESTFRLVIENAVDGMLLVDDDGRVLYANNAAAAIFGRNRNDLASMSLGHLMAGGGMTQMGYSA